MIEELLKMAEVESNKTMRKELEVFEERHNEIEDIINSSIDPVCAFLNMTDMQEVIEVNVNNVNELTWWLNISTICFIECNKNINNHDFVQKLKRMLLEYCMETSIYEYIKDNQYGKISLFDGFAYLNVFYLKRVMPSNDEVINGERNYRDIYQYFEDNKSCTLMQHEAYPFIEISDPKSSLLDKSKYENFYKKVFDSKDDNLDNNSIANQLKLIYESIVKVETTSPTQNKWKSLLLTYTSEEIMINTNVVTETSPKVVEETIQNVVKETIPKIVGETVQNVVGETAPKVMEEVAQKVLEETKIKPKNGGFNITEQILYFYYITGYWDNKLKEHSILHGRINANSIDDSLDRIKKFDRKGMSIKELEQYKPSLEKVKKYLSFLLKEKTIKSVKDEMQTAIKKVDDDIIKCEEFIVQKKNEEQAKKEKTKKKTEELIGTTK